MFLSSKRQKCVDSNRREDEVEESQRSLRNGKVHYNKNFLDHIITEISTTLYLKKIYKFKKPAKLSSNYENKLLWWFQKFVNWMKLNKIKWSKFLIIWIIVPQQNCWFFLNIILTMVLWMAMCDNFAARCSLDHCKLHFSCSDNFFQQQ